MPSRSPRRPFPHAAPRPLALHAMSRRAGQHQRGGEQVRRGAGRVRGAGGARGAKVRAPAAGRAHDHRAARLQLAARELHHAGAVQVRAAARCDEPCASATNLACVAARRRQLLASAADDHVRGRREAVAVALGVQPQELELSMGMSGDFEQAVRVGWRRTWGASLKAHSGSILTPAPRCSRAGGVPCCRLRWAAPTCAWAPPFSARATTARSDTVLLSKPWTRLGGQ